MKPRQFSIRDLFWSLTLFAIGFACVYVGKQGTSWSTFWFLLAPPAIGAGLMAPFRRKRAGMIWGAMLAVGLALALRAFDNPSKSSGISLWQSFASFFVGQPLHSWIIAAVFGVLFLLALLAKTRNAQIRSLPLFVAFLAWLAYGFLEREALIRKANIRIDLLLIWPILFCGTAIAIVLSVQSVLRAIKSNKAVDQTPTNLDVEEPVDLFRCDIPEKILGCMSTAMVRENLVIPLDYWQGALVVAMVDPQDKDVIERLQFTLNTRIEPRRATPAGIEFAINRYYRDQ